jgi:hypothetical protein
VFLGCLSCSPIDPASLGNAFGQYGNPFSGKSLFNPFNTYRNPYTSVSACNTFASHPPLIVDRQGRSYGELTLNNARPKQARAASVKGWLKALCDGRLD